MANYFDDLLESPSKPNYFDSLLSEEAAPSAEQFPDQVSRAASRPSETAPPLADTEDAVSRTPAARKVAEPGTSMLDVARNVGAGALKIGPTALEGVAQIGDLATGGAFDLGVQKAMNEGKAAIDQAIGTKKFNQDQAGFAEVLKDDNKSVGDMFGYLLDHPSVLVDQSITTIGSMLLPIGSAKAVQAGMLARGFGQAAIVKAVTAASIATGGVQNAADTFGETANTGASLADRYKGAAESFAISALVGVATGGGAEGQVARKLAGELQAGKAGAWEAAKKFLLSFGREATQESGEEVGNVLGEQTGGSNVELLKSGKRIALSGALGGILGGGTHAATSAGEIPGMLSERSAEGRADAARTSAYDKMGEMFAGVKPAEPSAAPVADIYQNAPNPQPPAPPAPAALPAPGQVAMPMPEALPTTQEPIVPPGQANADRIEAARAAEDARLASVGAPNASGLAAPQTASQIELDPNDPAASFAAIAAAPVTQIAPALSTPAGIDEGAHSAAAGDLASTFVEIEALKRQLKTAPTDQKKAISAQIEDLSRQSRVALQLYRAKNGPEAASHLQRVAAETYLGLKGNYEALRRPTVQETPASTGREQPAEVKNAEGIRSNEGQVRQGGAEGLASVQRGAVEGGGNLQQQAPEGAGNGAPQVEGNREQPVIEPTNVGAARAVAPVITSEVDRAAHEAAGSPLNERKAETPKQAGAGNYKMGHVQFTYGGLDFSVENPSGSIRTDKNIPPKWASRMTGYHYGYDRSAMGAAADSTEVKAQAPDWLVKDGTHPSYNGKVFVMDAINQKTGAFDEHKWMAGAKTIEEAKAGFAAQYPKGWKLGEISETTMRGYKNWKLTANPRVPYAPQPHTAGVQSGDRESEYNRWINGATDIVWSPDKFKSTIERKTRGSAVSVLREHGVEHVIMAPILRAFAENKKVNPIPLTQAEQSEVSAAVADAITLYKLPPVIFAATEGAIYKHTAGGDMVASQFGNGDSSISIRQNVLAAAMAGNRGWRATMVGDIIHETWHTNDGYGKNAATANSPRFEIKDGFSVGDVIKEAESAWRNSKDDSLRGFWDYPFNQDFDSRTLQAEVGAQLWLLYNTKPEVMRADHPVAFKLYEEIHAKLSAIDRTGNLYAQASDARRAVHDALGDQGVPARQRASSAVPGGRTPTIRNVSSGERGGSSSERNAKRSVSQAVDYRNTRGHILGDDATVLDVAKHFEKLVKNEFGGPLDVTDPKAVQRATEMAKAEVAHQITQARSGLDWYEEDIGLAHKLTARYIPEMKSGTKAGSPLGKVTATNLRLMFGIVAGMHSPQNPAAQNWEQAARNFKHFVATGKLEGMNPATKMRWAANVNPQPFNFLNAMIEDRGFNKTLEYLLTPHTVAELNALKHNYNIYKNAPVEGKKGDLKLGAHMFGPKVGPFSLGLNGINTEVAVDVWATRSIGRWFGNMIDHKGVIEAPTELQRKAFQKIALDVAKEMGYNPNQVQAVMWFFEQQLYTKMGIRSDTPKFSDGAINLLRKEGIKYDDLTGPAEDRAARIDAVHANDEARQFAREDTAPVEPDTSGNAVWDDFREDPESALKKPGWAILTGNLQGKSAEASAKSNARLEDELKHKGIEYQVVDGFWEGKPEGRSFLIFEPSKSALALAKRYNQRAITTNKGFEYTDGTVDAADHSQTVVGDEATSRAGYSVLPDGTAFSLGFPEQVDQLATMSGKPKESTNENAEQGRAAAEGTGRAVAGAERVAPAVSEKPAGGTAGEVQAGVDRASVVESTQLKGDGRGFTDFFTAASKGERAPDVKTYKPVIDISGIKDFSDEYVKHRGNFDDHIATSIPGFRETQQAVGAALVRSYPAPNHSSASMLDIAASEGAFNKAVTELSDGRIFTLGLDPNQQMAKFFDEHSYVPGADYDMSAFGSKDEEGKVAWTEDDGTKIKFFKPIELYDVVHEAMGFQFISNTRNAQFARVKELMKPDGIALFEEKIKEDTPQWKANEAQKDAYKARYFTAAQMKAKAAEVLEKGATAVAAEESKKEQATVGMNDLMTTGHEFETALTNNWDHVAQYWDSGNFKGYVASDSKEALDRFLSNLPNLNSEYSTVKTPNPVKGGEVPQTNNTMTPIKRQTDTPAFKMYFGDSKITNPEGKPLRLYHATPTSFGAFDMSKMSADSDWGPRIYLTNTPEDANANYAGVGPDLANKIDRMVEEEIANADEHIPYGPEYKKAYARIKRNVTRRMAPTKGIVMPLYARMENPFVVGGKNESRLDFTYEENADGDIVGQSGALNDLLLAIEATGEDYGVDTSDITSRILSDYSDGATASEINSVVRASRVAENLEDENGNSIGAGGFLSDALERAGYDGVVDNTVDMKFGSQKRRGKPMEGMNPNTVHYVVFAPTQVKSATGNAGTFDRENPQVNATQGGPGNPVSWDAPQIGGKWEDLIFNLQDKHVDTKKVQAAIQKFSGNISDAQDVYLQEELYHGTAAKASTDFVDRELKPLIQDMGMRKVSLKDFETFLHNRHAEERNVQIAKVNPELPDGGSGIKTADARAYLAALTPQQRTAFTALARRVDAITARTNQMLVAERLESQGTIDAWKRTYKDYVPLHREDMGDNLGGTGQGYSVKGSASKRATGSTLPVENILANIALAREKTITRGGKNRVANALVNLALANPNRSFWSVDSPAKVKEIGSDGLVHEVPDRMWKSRDNVVVARMQTANGDIVERGVTFNQRDERAVRMAQALKNLDPGQMNAALSVAAVATRWFASMNTQYNPIFGVVNLTRDVQQAMFNLTTTPIANRKLAVLKNVLPALAGVYRDLRAERKGLPPRSAWSQEFEEFQNAGGQTGYRDMFVTASDRTKAIEREIKHLNANKAARLTPELLKAVGGWLSDYNTAMENATRLAAFHEAKKAGLSVPRSASVGKNLTVNFNRKGNVSSQIGSLYAFFNASAQGTARMMETMKGPAGAKIIAGGVLLGVLQAFALAAAGFDDDDPPEFVREKNLIIPIGDKKYIAIPMPLGLHLLPSIGRIPTEMALNGFRNPGDRVSDLLSLAFDAFSPVGGGNSVGQVISPTPLDPVVAVLENKDWTGKPIAREDMSALNPTPGHTRAKDVATGLSMMISKAINSATGGTEYQPGVLSPSPDTIDYLAGQVGGGVWREASKAAVAASSLATGEELPTYKRPLVGRFYGDSGSQSSQSDAFYKNIIEINKHEAEIKGRYKNDEDAESYIENNPTSSLTKQADNAQKRVAKLRKSRREALAEQAPSGDIKEIEADITDAMSEFNQLVKDTREGH